MKKLNVVILFVLIGLICTGGYKLFFHEINEEYEVLNKDVSLNNIKSVMEVELEENENVTEIPLGYKDDKIYILKYTYDDIQNKIGKYDKTIYKIDENGLVTDDEINIPEEYCTSNELNIYGNYIFCGGSYYDWTTGEKTIVFSDQSEYEVSSVSGNKDYFLYEKKDNQEIEYYLVNIKSKDIYEFKVLNGSDDRIKEIFFDKDSSEFYAINYGDYMVKLNLAENSFSTEIYDNEVKFNYSNDEIDKEGMGYRYIYSDKGKVYFCSSKLENSDANINEEFNIKSYYIKDKYVEDIDSISVCGYDKYNSDCLLVKKKDDTSGKTYFAKFKNNNMDILMEIPNEYEGENSTELRMSDDANLLVSETYNDSANKKVENKYAVYNLKEYFNDNEYVLNNDGTWTGKDDDIINLQNTYKNIDDSQRENKEVITKRTEDAHKEDSSEIIETKNKSPEGNNNEKSEKAAEPDDYREHDPSWKQGNGDWYYFNNNNQKVTSGWIYNNGKWYYFDENGVMQKNALVLEHGYEFTLDENGVLLDSDNVNQQYLKDKSKEDPVEEEKENNKKENVDVNKKEKSDQSKNYDENKDLNENEKTDNKENDKDNK